MLPTVTFGRGGSSFPGGRSLFSHGPQQRHRRQSPAFMIWHPGIAQAHLDATERAHQHQVVEVAQVADAEDAVGDLRKPVTQ